MTRVITTILVSATLLGCTNGNGDYPTLVPENTIVMDESTAPDPAPTLYAQAEALRARAAAIRAQTP